ncbi:Sulfotransferase [Ostreococcus tauri]|uniref:Sulfotransferase n=1 Tax=Ostreococcus tauri TaxID=70448 RepID=A0A096P7P3_OSTTA|nr:Sulfotransferase [Ostreococcus tauri]CEG00205.1 Sulfotransferase [Ostreococcus tauri]|eukprot:XP_003082748.2 Sulfotransferase [Ostreococcus tauri]
MRVGETSALLRAGDHRDDVERGERAERAERAGTTPARDEESLVLGSSGATLNWKNTKVVALCVGLLGATLAGALAVATMDDTTWMRDRMGWKPTLGDEHPGQCALNPRGAEGTCAQTLMTSMHLWDAKAAPQVHVPYEEKLYECMSTPTSTPTIIPRRGSHKLWNTKNGTAYAWMFVHVPKAAGSYFIEMLKRNKNHENVELGPPATRNFMINGWEPLNSLWAREIPKWLWTMKKHRESGAGIYSQEFMRKDYDAGRRMYFTGATAVGMCDMVDAPCAYLTVLREPIDRMWSEYTYLCLEGNEGHRDWTAEEIANEAAGLGCPLDPLEWYTQKRSAAAQLTGLLAPRGGHTKCGAEAAKANLASGCVRYIFQDDLERGMARVRGRLPDLKHLGDNGGNTWNEVGWIVSGRNGSKEKLTPALAKRLEAYKANATIVAGLRELVRHDLEVYQFAKKNYDAHWNTPLTTC